MYLIYYVLFFLIVVYVGASLFKRKAEQSLLTSHLGIIVFLYFAYIFNRLAVGVVLIKATLIIACMIATVKIIREKTYAETLKRMVSPTLVIWGILVGCIFCITRGQTVKLIDELHLWAALPKILFYNDGSLQLGESALLLGYYDYPPGTSL